VRSRRITVFTGRFGSGKTEIALNYAIQLVDRGTEPLLVDLDIVTPYFRARDRAEQVARLGVEMVTPFPIGQHVHIPAISPHIRGAIEQTARPVVIDLGGDQQGARALAQYAAAVERQGYAMCFCVNPYRPFMDSVQAIGEAVAEIEGSSRLRVSALISNPNLMSSSTAQDFVQGHKLVTEASSALGLPIAFAATSRAVAESLDRQSLGVELLVLCRFFRMLETPDWS
jgi:hypothetical protein